MLQRRYTEQIFFHLIKKRRTVFISFDYSLVCKANTKQKKILCFVFFFLPWIFPACPVLPSRQLGLASNTTFIWFCQDCSWPRLSSSKARYTSWCCQFIPTVTWSREQSQTLLHSCYSIFVRFFHLKTFRDCQLIFGI